MTFDELLDSMPAEFSVARLREVAQLHSVEVPKSVQETLLDRGYRKCKVGLRKPGVPNKRWDTPTTHMTSHHGLKDTRN